MNSKLQRTLELIFSRPVCGSLPWWDIEVLFQGLWLPSVTHFLEQIRSSRQVMSSRSCCKALLRRRTEIRCSNGSQRWPSSRWIRKIKAKQQMFETPAADME
jgi:hypothetical protein